MQICIALLMMTLGGGLYALHAHICRKSECAAYNDGYEQAQKEDDIRMKAVERYKADVLNAMERLDGLLNCKRPAAPTEAVEKTRRSKEVFPPDFMDKLHENGRAVTKL